MKETIERDDIEDDDESDIPPALTAEQWAGGQSPSFCSANFISPTLQAGIADVMVDGVVHTRLRIGIDDGVEIGDPNELAALAALVNETLRRFDDPRALLREHVTLLREAAELLSRSGYKQGSFAEASDVSFDDIRRMTKRGEMYSELHEFADAIESYLPPVP